MVYALLSYAKKCAPFWSNVRIFLWEIYLEVGLPSYTVQLCLYPQVLYPSKAHKYPVVLHILLHVVLPHFLVFASMIHFKWYFVVLIWFSLITNKLRYFFHILITIWVSPSVKLLHILYPVYIECSVFFLLICGNFEYILDIRYC